METKKTIVIGSCLLGGPSLLVFLWALSGIVNKKEPLYLFGQVGASVYCYLFSISLAFVLLFFLLLAFLKQEKRFGLLGIPVLFLALFSLVSGLFIHEEDSAYELSFSSFSDSLIICNTRDFLSGTSAIYEKKDPVRLHYLTEVRGDDGGMPLEKREFYEIKEYTNGVAFTYHDENWEGHVYLAYDGTNFTLKDSAEGFQ